MSTPLNSEIFSRLGSSSTAATVYLLNAGHIAVNGGLQFGRASTNASLIWIEGDGANYWAAGLLDSETKIVTLTGGGILPAIDGSLLTNLSGSNVVNAVLTTGTYSNPAWITALSAAKLTTGTLPAAALPLPSAATLGGIQSTVGASHQWIASISTNGVPVLTQPAFVDISGTITTGQLPGAAVLTSGTYADPAWITSLSASKLTAGTLPAGQLPNPSTSTLGGVQSIATVSHQWIAAISTSGIPSLTQPAFSDISGTATTAQLPAAVLLNSGNLAGLASNATALTNIGAIPSTSGTATNLTLTGNVIQDKTIAGATGAININQTSGRVLFAASASSLVVTNSLVTANSIIQVSFATNDSTAAGLSVVAASGSFTIFLHTAPTGTTGVNFTVTN